MKHFSRHLTFKNLIKFLLICILLSSFPIILAEIYNSYFNGDLASKISNAYTLDEFEINNDGKNKNAPVISFLGKDESKKQKNVQKDELNTPICPEQPPDLIGEVIASGWVDAPPGTFDEIAAANPQVSEGGHHSPKDCTPRHRVAIIIPLRGRELQLRRLLSHMHPIWQRQQIQYTVYTITQAGKQLFNRAKLMNVGFAEASKDRIYDCYVFHDVDLMLKNDRCLYWCGKEPRHVAEFTDTLISFNQRYSLGNCAPLQFIFRQVRLFGGVSMMSQEQFYDVNGFSNLFWGWGGEDDDMYLRMWKKGYKTSQTYGKTCSFHMIEHHHEESNAANFARYALLNRALSKVDYEGLNTLRYRVLSVDKRLLYTNITVDLGGPSAKMRSFMEGEGMLTKCIGKMPWS